MSYHPNRLPFQGVLTYVDQRSDKAPSGARGHCVILTRAAALKAMHGLRGMAVNYQDGWEGHNSRQKVGVIEKAWLEDDALLVRGYIYARDFPEIVPVLEPGVAPRGVLGMSYEMADVHVADLCQKVWTLDRVTFTGAAILLCWRAAYRRTSIRLLQSRDEPAIAAGVEMRSIVDDSKETREREENGCEEKGSEVGEYREGAD